MSGLVRRHPAIFAAVSAWALLPLAMILVNVLRHGGTLTGAFGSDTYDQLAYLAWIRDSAGHWLASDLWQLRPTPHDYLQPMYFLSGLLVRAGMSIQLAYLLWIPVGLLALFGGFAAYIERMLDGRRRQGAGLLLALFYITPLVALDGWRHLLSPDASFTLTLATNDAYSALTLWGFDQTAIAVGLMPVFLLAAERLLAGRAGGVDARRRRAVVTVAAASGAVVSWLHPWQGGTLLIALGGLLAIRCLRRPGGRVAALRAELRDDLVLTVPVLATLAPLLYGALLAHFDPLWASFQTKTETTGTQPWWALLASLGPLGAVALAGVRRPADDGEWLLLLWLLAAALVYFLVPEFPPHALGGLPLPLAALAVRGWGRLGERVRRLALRAPRRPVSARRAGAAAWGLAAVAIAVVTLPQAAYQISVARQDLADPTHAAARQRVVLQSAQAQALAYLSSAPRGGVLAPPGLSMSVPALTGDPVYAGHVMWQPVQNSALAAAFYIPGPAAVTGPAARLVRTAGVRYVIADCGEPPDPARAILPFARPLRRYGCLTVYEVRAPARGRRR